MLEPSTTNGCCQDCPQFWSVGLPKPSAVHFQHFDVTRLESLVEHPDVMHKLRQAPLMKDIHHSSLTFHRVRVPGLATLNILTTLLNEPKQGNLLSRRTVRVR